MPLKIPAHYLVVDLEATCSDDGTFVREDMEIIEIGAVMVSTQTWAPLAEHQVFIRPSRHPQLTPFCKSLTTITQAEVDAGSPFPRAMESFVTWQARFDDVVLASWGAYDKKQLQLDCRNHRVRYPFGKRHLNIKQAFAKRVGIKRGLGMKAALEVAGLPMLGTHHRGIDDARNIAALLPTALGVVAIPPSRMPTRRGKKGLAP
jgi:inhibitor of KinA sporulation pathway (predicted exonuclease)